MDPKMNNTIELDGLRGRLDAGLPRRQLEALMYACKDLTMKEIARHMGVSPGTVKDRLDDARFKLGMQRSVRGTCLEAFRRGIVSPLAFALVAILAMDGHHTPTTLARRPPQ
ncbi:sigma factor-like helix-turn-helix DNA-binding protein, partial [Pseudomonas paralcaligenes]|uniref:sigma factor-like helix-turn-helix DNA-binding protein n=1 Tax=Pseudomonas paralcaligenes TaxID=2772558 RepID=UPI0021D18CF5